MHVNVSQIYIDISIICIKFIRHYLSVYCYWTCKSNKQQDVPKQSKRKREFSSDDMSKGVARARQFLEEFSNLPLDKMDLKEALQQVSQLRDGLKKDAVDSNWLQQFL